MFSVYDVGSLGNFALTQDVPFTALLRYLMFQTQKEKNKDADSGFLKCCGKDGWLCNAPPSRRIIQNKILVLIKNKFFVKSS